VENRNFDLYRIPKVQTWAPRHLNTEMSVSLSPKLGYQKKPWNNCSCSGTFTIFEHTITYPTYIQYIDLYKGYKGCLFHNPLPQQKQVFQNGGMKRSPTNYLIDIASTNLKITYHWRLSRILNPTSMSFTSRTSSMTSKSVQRKGGEITDHVWEKWIVDVASVGE
jgi:hypothetical protein